MTHTKTEFQALTLLIVILLVAFGLRLYQLNDISLWIDEGASGWFIHNMAVSATGQERLLFYFALNWPWVILLDLPGAFGLRWLSVLAGTLSVAVGARLGRLLGGPRTGLLSALLYCILVMHLYYAQEARPYVLVGLMALIMLWSALTLIKKPGARWAQWVYPLASMCIALLHSLSVLWVGVLTAGLIVIQLGRRRPVPWLSAAAALMLAGGLAVLTYFLERSLFELDWIPPVTVEAIRRYFYVFAGRGAQWMYDTSGLSGLAALIGIVCAAYLLIEHPPKLGGQVKPWLAALLAALTLLPLLALIVISQVWQSFFVLRYLHASLVTSTLLLAWALSSLPRLWRLAALMVVLGLAWPVSVRYMSEPSAYRTNWLPLLEEMLPLVEPDDVIITFWGGHRLLEFYLIEENIDVPIVSAPPPDASDELLYEEVTKASEQGSRVWLVQTAYHFGRLSGPDWIEAFDPAGSIELLHHIEVPAHDGSHIWLQAFLYEDKLNP